VETDRWDAKLLQPALCPAFWVLWTGSGIQDMRIASGGGRLGQPSLVFSLACMSSLLHEPYLYDNLLQLLVYVGA